MNKVYEIGRLTSDPEVRYSQVNEAMAIARYTLAVDRKYKKEGEPTADFISCVALGKQGEFAEKYLRKGMKIAIVGRIQTGSYTNKEGQKIYTTDVLVEEHEFVESRNASTQAPAEEAHTEDSHSDGFMNIPDGIDEELPFA